MTTQPSQLLSLPIDPLLPELVSHLERSNTAVVHAPPGTGKTTRIPPALLQASFAKGKQVLVLEPRRLAAKLSAERVAEEMGQKVGETVGYQFRFENVGGPRTRLRFLTEGMLMRKLLSDPELKDVSALVLDEFHERHLHGDISLAAARSLQLSSRPDLRIVVMSATLDSDALSDYLEAQVFRSESKRYDVEIEYREPTRYLEDAVRSAVQKELQSQLRGNILVFLPGMAEIRRAGSALSDLNGVRVLPLHGELSKEEQHEAIRPSQDRKIILATNIAETSLTIEGVSTVVDSGLARVAAYSWWSGIPALRTRPISRASAIQRAGRAGRTGPGRCVRLYPKTDFDGRAPFEAPEIQRADLAQTVLELLAMKRDPRQLTWFEKPPANALDAAFSLLHRLGAVSDEGRITPMGQEMARLPAHPRLARLVLEGERQGCGADATLLAAVLSEGRAESFDILASLKTARRDAWIQKVARRLQPDGAKATTSSPRGLAFALLTAFPDRVAKLARRGEVVLSAGGSAAVDESAIAGMGEYFVAVELDETQRHGQARSQLRLRSLCTIDPDWLLELEPSALRESEELLWDRARAKVEAAYRLNYDALVLTESRSAPADAEAAAAFAGEMALKELHLDNPPWEAWLNRYRFLQRAVPELELKEIGPKELARALGELVLQGQNLAKLEAETIEPLLNALLDSPAQSALARQAPTAVTLARGRRVRVNYEPGKPPWVASRIQDFFGMREGPSILNGRLLLTVHLLAPSQRPVQVTQDLAGFWKRGYAEVRRELARRYPKHAWPEDPTAVVAPRP